MKISAISASEQSYEVRTSTQKFNDVLSESPAIKLATSCKSNNAATQKISSEKNRVIPGVFRPPSTAYVAGSGVSQKTLYNLRFELASSL